MIQNRYRFEKVVLLSDQDSQGLTEKIYSKLIKYSQHNGRIPGGIRTFNSEDLLIKTVKNGERIPEIKNTVRGRHVYVIKSFTNNGTYEPNIALIESFTIANACRHASADRVTLVAPHLSYLRQDRRSTDKESGAEKREPVTAGLISDLLKASGYSGLVTIDPHFDQFRCSLPNEFQLETPTARIAIANHIQSLNLNQNTTAIFSPDYGGGRRAEALARDLKFQYGGLCRKRRAEAGKIGDMTILPEEGINLEELEHAIIIDDIIDSGKTLEECKKALTSKGVQKVIVAATHGIFSDHAQERLTNNGIRIITTNAIPQIYKSEIEIVDLSTILAVTIHCIATGHGSISRKLFNIHEYQELERKLTQ